MSSLTFKLRFSKLHKDYQNIVLRKLKIIYRDLPQVPQDTSDLSELYTVSGKVQFKIELLREVIEVFQHNAVFCIAPDELRDLRKLLDKELSCLNQMIKAVQYKNNPV